METGELPGHPPVQFPHKPDTQRFQVSHPDGSCLDGLVCVRAIVVEHIDGNPDGPGFGTGVSGDPGQDGVQMAADDGIASGIADGRVLIVYSGPESMDNITYTVKQLSSSVHQSSYFISMYKIQGLNWEDSLATRAGTQVPAKFN